MRINKFNKVPLLVLVSALFVVTGCQPWRAAWAESEVVLTEQDRVLILAPHPDDEVLGCGGVIQQAVARGVPLQIAYLTFGDSNQWSFMVYRKRPVVVPRAVRQMGQVRYQEALAATAHLGVSPEQLVFLGYPDYGTLNIWNGHWHDRPPLKSLLTRVTAVPYQNAFRPGALYKGDDILQDLKDVMLEFRPTKIFVSHPADHNPDHRALYLFSRVALWDLRGQVTAQVYPYLIHFRRWPKPYGLRKELALNPPGAFQDLIAWSTLPLNAHEARQKYEALKAHRSQYQASKKYLTSFIRGNELFGDFRDIGIQDDMDSLPLTEQGDPPAVDEELTAEERKIFVGLEDRYVDLESNRLVLTVKLSRPIAEETELSVFVFGYRFDKPFNQMPKLHLKFGTKKTAIFNQAERVSRGDIQVTRGQREIVVSIPLEVLDSPHKILTSARTYTGQVPLDWVSWRVLSLSAG